MKNLIVTGLALVVSASVALAEDVKSGPQTGDRLGAFYVTKCAGAETDGVKEGKELCYRCRNSRKPQVVIFTRSTDPKVVDLIKKIDKAIASHKAEKLTSFVNVLGDDQDELQATARKLAKTSGAKAIPFVVPNEFENGPANYGINPKAAVTVILANQVDVKANVSVKDVKELKAEEVIANIKKIL